MFNVSCPPQAFRPFGERPTICNCRANAHIHLPTAKMTFLMPYCRHNMRDKRQNVKKNVRKYFAHSHTCRIFAV